MTVLLQEFEPNIDGRDRSYTTIPLSPCIGNLRHEYFNPLPD